MAKLIAELHVRRRKFCGEKSFVGESNLWDNVTSVGDLVVVAMLLLLMPQISCYDVFAIATASLSMQVPHLPASSIGPYTRSMQFQRLNSKVENFVNP